MHLFRISAAALLFTFSGVLASPQSGRADGYYCIEAHNILCLLDGFEEAHPHHKCEPHIEEGECEECYWMPYAKCERMTYTAYYWDEEIS